MTGAFLGGVLFTLFIAFIVYKVREAKNKDRTGTGSGGGTRPRPPRDQH